MADLSHSAELRPLVNEVLQCQASFMAERTSLYQALDRLMKDESLADFVTRHRHNERSWRRIAAEIEKATGIKVSHEALRDWFPELAERVTS